MEKERQFKDILAEFLRLSDIKQVEFAEKTGIHFGTISGWLKGRSKPDYDSLKRMVLNLEAHANYWLGIDDVY